MKLIKQSIFVEALDREARLYVGLPEDYDQSAKRYPVVYMHDGHNVFLEDDAFKGVTWEMLELHAKHPDILEFIVVALDCAEGESRLDEYGPFYFDFPGVDRTCGGKGDEYLSYLAYTLKPMIDSSYRTLKEPYNTSIIGSSMGGIISLYAGLKYQDVFGRIGSVSGSYFVSEQEFIDLISKANVSSLTKVYLDTGDSEVGGGDSMDYVASNLNIYHALRQKLPPNKLSFQIIENGKHFEADWAERLPDIIRSLWS